ncbi:MAG: gliding motility-associated C-terminal domain-containing protein, partial [Chryseotalea sp.]
QESDVYCYRVMTRGTYGNPALPEPLENYSQILCAQPNDSNPPTCSPVVSIENLKNCEEYILNENNCGADAFDITVTWNINDQCGDDVIGYRVYAANAADQVFTLVDNLPNVLGNGLRYTRDTFYIDAGLTSLARCYKISAIDRSGNESPLSNAVCSDNCPYYELPNVFTPNNDGCNDTFSAFRNTSTGEELPDGACGPSPLDRYRCARFVEKVTFKVYNRWGNPVYEFESSLSENSEKSIYIDWNGKDDNNNLLPAGVYFYQADVVFDSSDPAKRTRTIKSWVHLVR